MSDVTIYDVAKLASVSISTVSRVLNSPEQVNQVTRARVQAAIDRLHFVPKAEATARARKGTRRIGVLAPFITYPSFVQRFRGVATIVLKLFQLAPADRAYFGRKDYQQTIVVRQMVADLNVPIEVRVCPTIRESDGLAMSSRNVYLSPEERRRALSLSRSLQLAERAVKEGERDVAKIRTLIERELDAAGGIDVQYIAFVADGTVTPVERIDGPTTVALAAQVGKTRLIDNMLLNVRVAE